MPTVKVLSSTSSPRAKKVDGVRIWIAVHSDLILANGWQPYDQPDTAAYPPLGRERLHQVECHGGVLLIEREPRRP